MVDASRAVRVRRPRLSSVGESGKTPSTGQSPTVVFRPKVPQQRGRQPHRAAGVGADGVGAQAGRDRDRRSAARPARDALGLAIVRVPGRSAHAVGADGAEREFDGLRLAENDRALALQRPDEAAFRTDDIADVEVRAGPCRHAVDGQQILHRDRNAHQRAKIDAGAKHRVERRCGRERGVRGNKFISSEPLVQLLDAPQVALDRRHDGGLAASQAPAIFGDRDPFERIGNEIHDASPIIVVRTACLGRDPSQRSVRCKSQRSSNLLISSTVSSRSLSTVRRILRSLAPRAANRQAWIRHLHAIQHR